MSAILAAIAVLTLVSATAAAEIGEPRQTIRIEAFEDGANRPDSPDVLTFFALGDWGTGDETQRRVAGLLKREAASLGERDQPPFVLAAGDNVYPSGLTAGWRNPRALEQLEKTFAGPYREVKYLGKALTYHIVNGNHDHEGDIAQWEAFAEGLFDGRQGNPRVLAYNGRHGDIPDSNDQAEYQALRAGARFAGLPERVEVASGLVNLVAMDSEVLLEHYAASAERPELRKTVDRHWQALADLCADNQAPWIVLVAHHPVSTYGPHAGYPRSLYSRSRAWVTARWPGVHQDLGDPAYKDYIGDFRAFADRLDRPVLLVSGHEHSLQLIRAGHRLVQLVSGAAGRTSPVVKGPDSLFASSTPGFARIDATADAMWLEFVLAGDADSGPRLFRLRRVIDSPGPTGSRVSSGGKFVAEGP